MAYKTSVEVGGLGFRFRMV